MSELDTLRAALDAADRRLYAAAAERMQLVAKIGAAKQRAGIPLFDRTRERTVRDNVEAIAADVGLAPEIGDGLLDVLLEASHRKQAAIPQLSSVQRNILIIGGNGRMGRLLSGAFEGRGHTVDVYDLGDARALETVVAAAEIVMLAVPMDHVVAMVERVLPCLPSDALLCDINSLKTEVCQAMAAAHCEVLGLHPMFGPSVQSLRRQKVVCCPVRPGPLGEWLQTELAQLGCELVDATPEAHDKMMAVVQVLVHFRTLATGAALRKWGVDIRESLRFTSPIYRLELAFTGRLFAQDPELYATIEMSNPHGTAARAIFVEAAAELLRLIETGDRAGFTEAFNATTAYFDDFGDEAMALSDHLIERLVRRA